MATPSKPLPPPAPPATASSETTPSETATVRASSESLKVVRIGVVLSIATILFGFILGGVLGCVEDAVKAHLRATAEANVAIYAGDQARLESTLGRAFTYMKRAHMHGGGIGTATLAIAIALALLGGTSTAIRASVATALGAGGLGYSMFWMLAGLRTPALGGTGPAKESLAWLAIPSTALLLVGVVAALVLICRTLFLRTD